MAKQEKNKSTNVKKPKPPTKQQLHNEFLKENGAGKYAKSFLRKPVQKTSNSNFSLPSFGGIMAVLFACLIAFVVHAKLTGQNYVGIGYWLDYLGNCPVVFDLEAMYNLLPAVDLPNYLAGFEVLFNFLINTLNIFVGSLAVLANLLELVLWFLAGFIVSFGA